MQGGADQVLSRERRHERSAPRRGGIWRALRPYRAAGSDRRGHDCGRNGRLRIYRRHHIASEFSQDRDVLAIQLVRFLGHPAVPDDGQLREPRGHDGSIVSRRQQLDRALPRRPYHGSHRWMRRLRDDQWLVARNRSNDGASLAARAAPIQICKWLCHRRARRRRHARDPDSAVNSADHLRDHGGGKHRSAVPGRLRAGHSCHRWLPHRHLHCSAYRPAGPAGRRATSAERWAALGDIWTVAIIFLVVMGGIYSGIFTPTEGAGIGAMGTFLVAIFYGGMRLSGFIDALLETAITSAMIFLILLGAGVFNAFLGFSQLPIWAAEQFQNSGLPPYTILIGMIILYLFLGCIMDSLAMILITIPIFWPIIAALDFGLQPDDLKLWFGIITLSVVEIGLITPPVGLNVFVINSLAKDVPMIDTFRGVIPFLASDFVRVTLIVGLPILSLFLPKLFGS